MTIPRNVLTVAPTANPVLVAEVKDVLNLVHCDDDARLEGLIEYATRWVENEANRAFITQTRKQDHDCIPCVFYLRRSPVQSVTSIVYTDEDSASQTIASSVYVVDTDSVPGRIALDEDQVWPTDVGNIPGAVVVTYVAGYGDDAADVPVGYRQAIKMLAAYEYDPSIGCGRTAESYYDFIRDIYANEGCTVEYA